VTLRAAKSLAAARVPDRIRVFVAAGGPLFREGLCLLLDRELDIEVVGAGTHEEAATEAIRALAPDVAVLDQEAGGLGILRSLRDFSRTRLLILTKFDGPHYLEAVVEARGALSYLPKKTAASVEFVSAVRSVAQGNGYIPSAVTLPVLKKLGEYAGATLGSRPLSEREFDVLEMVIVGAANKEIADRLGITESTVKVHLRKIFARIGAKNRAHAVQIAFHRSLVPFPTAVPQAATGGDVSRFVRF
jgi:DNA-binding NarL/FixJ family response regulator